MARGLAAIWVGYALYGWAQGIEPVKAAKVSLRRQAVVQHPDELSSVGDRFCHQSNDNALKASNYCASGDPGVDVSGPHPASSFSGLRTHHG